jgi:hypothetical protein
MGAPIKHQIIEKDGKPLFVLVSYEQYIKTTQRLERDDETTIPRKVVELSVLGNKSPMRT